MAAVRKAVVAVVGAVVAVLAIWHVDVPDDVVTAIVTVATAIAVYWVPNG